MSGNTKRRERDFRTAHLRQMESPWKSDVACPVCKSIFPGDEAYRRHFHDAHGNPVEHVPADWTPPWARRS